MAEEKPGADLEELAAERAEGSSAGRIVQMVAKAARGFAMYLPNNPLHDRYFEELRVRLDEHLDTFGALRLSVEHDVFRLRGETVYANPELRENLAFRLFADGVRAISLEEGIEPRELRTFVETVAAPAAEDAEDDIVTRLWAAELPHVLYVLADLPPPADPAALGVRAEATTQEDAVRRVAATLAAPAPAAGAPVQLGPGRQVYSISEEEIAALQRSVAGEEARSPFEDVRAVLESILAGEPDEGLFAEIAGLVGRLAGDLLLTGRTGEALELVSLLNRAEGLHAAAPARVAAVAAARARVVAEDSLPALAKVLDSPDGIPRDHLHALVTSLGRAAVGPFCRLLGDVAAKDTRKVLVEALAATAREAPELLLPTLEDERWYLVRNTIYILRRVASPAVTAPVIRCVAHRDPRVRKEVLLYFDEVDDPAGDGVAIKLLEDDSPPLRIAAMRSLARRRSRVGAGRLLALVAQPAFRERGIEERQAAYESLGELDPAATLPLLRELLLKRRILGAAREAEDVACAAGALRRLATPEAVALLREAAGRRRGRSREIVEEALRGALRTSAGRTAEAGRDRG